MSLFTSQPGLVALLESERDGIAERRGAAGNMHECSARIEEALERAEVATKEQKKAHDYLRCSRIADRGRRGRPRDREVGGRT